MSESSAIDQISELRQEIAELESEVSALKESVRWTPTWESLPPKDGSYICLDIPGKQYFIDYIPATDEIMGAYFKDGKWSAEPHPDYPCGLVVTHWMPLPPVEQGKL